MGFRWPRWTQRPQNSCTKCGYTWYPRGHDLSSRCPNCGSAQVGLVPVAGAVGGAALLVVLLISVLFSSSAQDSGKSSSRGGVPSKAGVQVTFTTELGQLQVAETVQVRFGDKEFSWNLDQRTRTKETTLTLPKPGTYS